MPRRSTPPPTGHDWLPLGPASRALGVGPDTLRRWADTGRIASYTTPGGHRRFSRRALAEVTGVADPHAAPLARLGGTPQRLTNAYRRSYRTMGREKSAQPARAAVPAPDRSVFRDDGRALIDAIVRHLDAVDPAARTAAEADAGELADDLGRRLGRAGISLTESVGSFVAGRRPLLSELGAMARGRDLPAPELGRLFETASGLLDRLLLRFIAAHLAADPTRPRSE